jgi:lycopene cyclase domain-containing protein
MKKFHYLQTLFFVFCIPTFASAAYLSSYISFNALIPFIILVAIIGSMWDVWATRHGKKDRIWLWQFNHRQTLGIRFLGLPIEEYLFYVASSLYVIFMWEGLKLMVKGTDTQVYFVIAGLSAWTLISILIPYFLGRKKDKFIG